MTIPADVFKISCILLYAGSGGYCLRAALPGGRPREAIDPGLVLPMTVIAAACLLLASFAMAESYLLLGAVAAGTTIFAIRDAAWKAPFMLLSAAAAVTLVLSLAWWRIEPGPASPWSLAGFSLVLAGLNAGFSMSWKHRDIRPSVFIAAFLIAGLFLLIDLGAYRPDEPILGVLAHHWGAYIGPALHVRAGLVPFHDVPLQYSIGPTLTILAACGVTDCWTGMEWVVVGMNLAGGALMLRMVLATSVPRNAAWRYAATIVVFAAVFIWPGAAPMGSGFLATPSVGGMRFMPVILIAYLLYFGHPAAATATLIPAVLWSPESAAMSVAVYGLCETARIGFMRALLRGAGVFAGSLTGMLLSHRAVFGVWMDPLALLEYVFHVPGPLPVDPLSDAMLLAVVIGLGCWLVGRGPRDSVTTHRDRVSAVLLIAVSSYWLGRSHPNNVCNLLPFLVLVGFRVLDQPAGDRSPLARVTRFGLATSTAALAMSTWHLVPFDFRGTIDIRQAVAAFPALEPDIERIRTQISNSDGLGIADFGPIYRRHPSERVVWTPMDPSSLWSYVPSERRRLYIRRSAARLRNSGWAIIEENQRFLFDDLLAAYTVAQSREFVGQPSPADGSRKHYLAVCFDPRLEIAAAIVGPACPSAPALGS
jgi:hypothetical protein